MIKPTLIEQLVLIRRRLGHSCKEAAQRWGLNSRTLGSYERGERSPSRFAALYLQDVVAKEEAGTFTPAKKSRR